MQDLLANNKDAKEEKLHPLPNPYRLSWAYQGTYWPKHLTNATLDNKSTTPDSLQQVWNFKALQQ